MRPDSYAPGDTYSSESAIVIEQLFRGLLRIDHDLNVVPELAQNMNVSADGLTYLFMLREDACWSDGHPLTAGDFVYAWRKLREEGHVTAFLLDDIASAEALDDWTLEVHLREPRNYFPYVLASHWAYPWPRHRADEVGAAWRRPESLVGNGPFVLSEVDEAGARLTANPHWRTAVGQRRRGAHRLPRPRERRRSTSGSRAATTSSSCATRRSPPPTPSRSARRRSRRRSSGFNVGNEPMADERVRRALAHAIDSAALVAESPGRRSRGRHAAARSRPSCRATATRRAAVRPRARARAARRGGLPGWRGPARSCVWMRARGRRRPRSPSSSPRSACARASRRRASTSASPHETHAWFAGWHADYPDPDGFYLGLLELDMPLYRDEETDAVAGAGRAALATATSGCGSTASSSASGSVSAPRSCPISYSRQLVLRRPNVHGLRLNPMGAFHLEQVVVDPAARALTVSCGS